MREHALTRSPLTAYAGEETNFEVWFARLAFDETTTWPSDLPAGGRVGWAKFRQADDGWTEVVYPEVKSVGVDGPFVWNCVSCAACHRKILDGWPRILYQMSLASPCSER